MNPLWLLNGTKDHFLRRANLTLMDEISLNGMKQEMVNH